jgi:hypothetical protein
MRSCAWRVWCVRDCGAAGGGSRPWRRRASRPVAAEPRRFAPRLLPQQLILILIGVFADARRAIVHRADGDARRQVG